MKIIPIIIIIFILGWISSSLYSNITAFDYSKAYGGTEELNSPGNWIEQENIDVVTGGIVMKIPKARIARFSDTNSMDPIIDIGTNSIEIEPDYSKLQVGDIVSYKSEQGTVVHRIIEIGEDSEGWYCRTKGDNNDYADSKKIRKIKGVIVGIIY